MIKFPSLAPFVFLLSLFAVQAVGLAVAAQSIPTVVSLVGLPVDSPLNSFTDPRSGAVFTNAFTPASNIFIVDFWPSYTTLPHLTPGLVISANGFVPGGGVSMPYNFSFTMTLPTPASDVEAIMSYADLNGVQGTMLMKGFDESGNQVAATSVQPSPGSFLEQPLSLLSEANNIKIVTFLPTNLFDAIGGISFISVPEPSTLALLTIGAIGLLTIRRRSPL
ncbi:MAG TPA: PEP-CTERM sorting domain-containing protein [Pirellulales bacterium]|jgi:hypothetical protein